MDISMYLTICLISMKGNFHVPCYETQGKVQGNFQVPPKQTYGKVHGNFHVPRS